MSEIVTVDVVFRAKDGDFEGFTCMLRPNLGEEYQAVGWCEHTRVVEGVVVE
jgi:hypothetical protein